MTRAPVYLDANIFIYAAEEDSDRGEQARAWIGRVERGELVGVTSELTLAEALPYPMVKAQTTLVEGYLNLLVDRPVLRLRSITRGLILTAARLRADLGLTTPDALHVATALDAGCEGFLTQDARLRLPTGLERIDLSQAAAYGR